MLFNSFWHELARASLVSIWKCNLAAFQQFLRFSFLSLDFYCGTTYFSSRWYPRLDAFYNCSQSNPSLFERYRALSAIFTLRLTWFIDVNFIFIVVTQLEWIDRVRPSCYDRSSVVKIFKPALYSLYKFANHFYYRRNFAAAQQRIRYSRNHNHLYWPLTSIGVIKYI